MEDTHSTLQRSAKWRSGSPTTRVDIPPLRAAKARRRSAVPPTSCHLPDRSRHIAGRRWAATRGLRRADRDGRRQPCRGLKFREMGDERVEPGPLASDPSGAPTAVPHVRVRPDDRTAPLLGRQRFHDLHRVGRRPRLHASIRGRPLQMRMGLVGPSSKNSICDLYNSPVTSAAASSSGAVAVGNSNGDIEMLRLARTHQRDALRILVRHGDQERERRGLRPRRRGRARQSGRAWRDRHLHAQRLDQGLSRRLNVSCPVVVM